MALGFLVLCPQEGNSSDTVQCPEHGECWESLRDHRRAWKRFWFICLGEELLCLITACVVDDDHSVDDVCELATKLTERGVRVHTFSAMRVAFAKVLLDLVSKTCKTDVAKTHPCKKHTTPICYTRFPLALTSTRLWNGIKKRTTTEFMKRIKSARRVSNCAIRPLVRGLGGCSCPFFLWRGVVLSSSPCQRAWSYPFYLQFVVHHLFFNEFITIISFGIGSLEPGMQVA